MTTFDRARQAVGVRERDAYALPRVAATLFTLAVLVHNFDHVRRGVDAVQSSVFWTGTAAIVVEVGVVWLVFARHRLAPLACVAAGSSLALGYVLVHFTPQRSFFSDSLAGAQVATLFAAGFETAAAVVLAAAGFVAHRRGAEADASPSTREELLAALRHPVVLASIVGNVALLVASFVEL